MSFVKGFSSTFVISLISPFVFAGDGSQIYNRSCVQCHGRARLQAPAPKSEAMQARFKERGYEGIWHSLMHGRARMPKKGGCFECSEAELRQALGWMLSQ